MNFQVAAKPWFSALFIFPKPSAMFDVTDHEALLSALQNPPTPTSSHPACCDSYLASPW